MPNSSIPPQNYQDAIYESYRSAFKGTANSASLAFGASKMRPVIEPWVADLSRDSVILDLGCGAGELLLAFQQLGFQNLGGCDLSEQQIELAKTISTKVVVANLFDFLIAQQDESVDVVTLFDVIEHLSRQETFDLFGLIRTKLRRGGILIGHVPNGLSPFVGHVYFGDPTHKWCPTPTAMRTMLNVSGYTDYNAKEHLGTSPSFSGRLRALAWQLIRIKLSILNRIETGSSGPGIWTRNFAFMAKL